MTREIRVQIFDSFEEENLAERKRQASLTIEERLREFSVLQGRQWGEQWTREPMVRKASWELLTWR